MRETRLARATVAELRRQLDEERRMQMDEMEKRRGDVRLNDQMITAMSLLTDKVLTSSLHMP